jgi:CRP-like cAMP-binding protein
VSLSSGETLYEQDRPISHVYFPLTAVCSLVVVLDDGKQVEASAIGNEGMVGVHVVLDMDHSPVRAIAQIPGECLRASTGALLRAMKQGVELERLLRRYAGYSLRFVNQAVACNTLHSVEKRACRWLLTAQDGVGKDEFWLTHEFLAIMLGVRRQTVTAVAGTLQDAGLIRYRRGLVRVLNRAGLETASCECYQITRNIYQRVFN